MSLGHHAQQGHHSKEKLHKIWAEVAVQPAHWTMKSRFWMAKTSLLESAVQTEPVLCRFERS